MDESYTKVGDMLEVTTNHTILVSELQLLEEKQRLLDDKAHKKKELIKLEAEIEELNNKLDIINEKK